MEQPLALNAENSRAKVQNVGGDSLVVPRAATVPHQGCVRQRPARAANWT